MPVDLHEDVKVEKETPKCPTCGEPMKRSNFRTGSVDHPGHEVETCPNCGKFAKPAPEPEATEES
jgi:ribosomal protein S27AE